MDFELSSSFQRKRAGENVKGNRVRKSEDTEKFLHLGVFSFHICKNGTLESWIYKEILIYNQLTGSFPCLHTHTHTEKKKLKTNMLGMIYVLFHWFNDIVNIFEEEKSSLMVLHKKMTAQKINIVLKITKWNNHS